MTKKFLLHKKEKKGFGNSIFGNPSPLSNDLVKQKAIMPSTLLLIVSVFVLSLTTSCFVTKKTSKIEKISFGNGGGFTGNVTEYTLFTNGEIERHQSITDEKTIIKTIDKNEVIKINNQISKLNYRTYTFNHPGNTYSFLRIVEESGKEYYFSWGEPSKQVKAEITLFYTKLTNLVK
jgi:hypothetical protein